MPEYRRFKEPGAIYFFTVVTYHRQKFLCDPISRNTLRISIQAVKKNYPFNIDAFALLPDHLHCIWTLPENDGDFSKRWSLIKKEFSRNIKNTEMFARLNKQVTESGIKRRESFVWQRRFWERQIRTQDDFNKYCDYIHYNPVKHAYVDRASKWPYSSFHRYVKSGMYPEDWGTGEPGQIKEMDWE